MVNTKASIGRSRPRSASCRRDPCATRSSATSAADIERRLRRADEPPAQGKPGQEIVAELQVSVATLYNKGTHRSASSKVPEPVVAQRPQKRRGAHFVGTVQRHPLVQAR